VKIWEDNWVPLPMTYRIQFPSKNLASASKVHELINWEMKWWDQNMLASLFSVEEVAAINSILISLTNQPDCQI
jgi:hypothetical protein